jgi:glycosyltransferase involved in cell wall biosynthesis
VKPLVLHVAAFSNPGGGGFIDAIERLARCDGVSTALLCPETSVRFPWAERLRSAGVRLLYAGSQLDVCRTVARVAPAVVHAHFVDWAIAAAIGGRAAGARVAWHLHSGAVRGSSARDLARRLKYASASRLVERFFCVSPDIVRYLQGYGVPSARITELANGVDLERFRPPLLRERAAARQQFGLAPRDRVVVFFGRDAAIKGADRLARALARTKTQPVVLAVAASRATLAELGGARVVDAGILRDVRQVFWAGDALVLPSRTEGITYALLEARACGLPAAASALPGIEQTFFGDPGSALVDADDPQALASAIDAAVQRQHVALEGALAKRISLDGWAEALLRWYVNETAA